MSTGELQERISAPHAVAGLSRSVADGRHQISTLGGLVAHIGGLSPSGHGIGGWTVPPGRLPIG